ncbi:hypothetical protein JCM10003_711 [Bacteroides pyogenes JCM 10003]|nr:hypothetical protein JCM10003_711 [Bacteroides pyogenes JCM 10003]SUV35597.1 Uncharacterised protein [Bacteroides pyogenes]
MKESTGLAVDPFINKNQKFGKRFLCYFLFQHTSRKKVAGGVSARWFIILQIYLYHIR